MIVFIFGIFSMVGSGIFFLIAGAQFLFFFFSPERDHMLSGICSRYSYYGYAPVTNSNVELQPKAFSPDPGPMFDSAETPYQDSLGFLDGEEEEKC